MGRPSLGCIFMRCVPACVSLVLAACAAQPTKPVPMAEGDVGVHAIAAADSERYAHSLHTDFIQPLAYNENAIPDYPQDLLSRRLPSVPIVVRLIVDTAGAVTDVTSLDAATTPDDAAFLASVRKTCLQWKFTPLIRLDLDAGPTKVIEDDGTTAYPGRPTMLPFHLDYLFNFSQRDGRPRVDAIDKRLPR